MNIGQEDFLEKVVIYLLQEQEKSTPGIELVVASRVNSFTASGSDQSHLEKMWWELQFFCVDGLRSRSGQL